MEMKNKQQIEDDILGREYFQKLSKALVIGKFNQTVMILNIVHVFSIFYDKYNLTVIEKPVVYHSSIFIISCKHTA